MRRAYITLYGQLLRGILGAVLLLASVASARLQGDMAALSIALGGTQVLCLTGGDTPSPDQAPGTAHLQSCVLCSLPMGAAPTATHIARLEATRAPLQSSIVALFFRFEAAPHHFARGPPLIG